MDELLARMKTRLRYSGDTEEEMLTEHLLTAIAVVNDRRQYEPVDDEVVESQYKSLVVELAVVAYNKMGAEGQLVHAENDVDRAYESGMYPKSLLKLIIPRPRKYS